MILPEKLLKLEPYVPVDAHCGIKLDANENAVSIDGRMRARVMEAMMTVELNRYPDPANTELRRAAAAFYGVDPENIGCGCGSDELLSMLMNNFLSQGDRVVMSSFDFSMYTFYAENASRVPIKVQVDEKLRLNPDELIKAVRENDARMVIFSNPCNPTGQGLMRDDVLKIVRSCDCLVVVDEAYMDFWNQSVYDEIRNYDNLIVLRTCSKAFGLAAIRCGFLLANPKLVDLFDRQRSPYNINTLTQTVAACVLSDAELLTEMTRACIRRADSLRLMTRGLCAAHPERFVHMPTVTNFSLLRVLPDGTWSARYCHDELRARQIGIRLLKDTYLRITAGTDDENSAVVLAIDELLNRLEA